MLVLAPSSFEIMRSFMRGLTGQGTRLHASEATTPGWSA
jgi:hypothetical protein